MAFAAFHVGSGLIGAAAAGVVVAAVLLAIGRFTFAMVQTPILKLGVVLLYALPAAVAGYSVTLGLSHIGIPSELWRQGTALVGAGLVGTAAFKRISTYTAAVGGRGVAGQPAFVWTPRRADDVASQAPP